MGGGGWWDPAAPIMGTALVVVRGWVGVGRRRTSVDVAEIGRKARGGARKAWGSRAWRIGAFVTVPGLIAGSGLVASAYGLGVMGSSHASECTPQVVQAPARDSFDVRVLNASGIDKRAGTVAKELATRGFAIVEASGVGDGGMQSRVDIAYGDEGLDGALLLAGQVKDARLFDDGRKGTTVTLVIGGDFAGLAEVPAPPPPRAQELKVNVYNTTFRSGLATDVGKELAARGFTEGKVGNDPDGSFLPDDVAVIRYGPDSKTAAEVLAPHVPGAVLREVSRPVAPATKNGKVTGRQIDTTLDLVLGNHYTALAPAASIPAPPPEPPTVTETVSRPCSGV